MRVRPISHFAWLLCALGLALPHAAQAEDRVAVSVVRSAEWSPESGRAGAGEFLVLLEGAKLQKASSRSGLVVVGDHNGLLRSGGERALRRLALSGVIVVRLASGGATAAIPEMLFVDASGMSEATAAATLRRALDLTGEAPRAADADHPSSVELAAVQAHLKQLQRHFDAASALALNAGPAPAIR